MLAPDRLPSLVSIVGVDGSGKTTLANWLIGELTACGHRPLLVWSRFRNYLSKPLLALTRVTGHNHREVIDGVEFGFHDFERLFGYRELFVVLQAVDVNIAAYLRIGRLRGRHDVVVCERGPWDTMVDVTTDTGMSWLPHSALGMAFTLQVRKDARVLWINRERDNILSTRPELRHDYKLQDRIDCYRMLAEMHGWSVIDNNGDIDTARRQLAGSLGLQSGAG